MLRIVHGDIFIGDRFRFHDLVFRIEQEISGRKPLVLIHEGLPDFQVRYAGARHHAADELLPGEQHAVLVFEKRPAFDRRIVQRLEILGLVEFAVRVEHFLLPDVLRWIRADRLQYLGVGYADALLTDVLFEQREVYTLVPYFVDDFAAPEFVHAAALLLAVDFLLAFHFKPHFLVGHGLAVDRTYGILPARAPAGHVSAPFQADQSYERYHQDDHDDVGSFSQ